MVSEVRANSERRHALGSRCAFRVWWVFAADRNRMVSAMSKARSVDGGGLLLSGAQVSPLHVDAYSEGTVDLSPAGPSVATWQYCAFGLILGHRPDLPQRDGTGRRRRPLAKLVARTADIL